MRIAYLAAAALTAIAAAPVVPAPTGPAVADWPAPVAYRLPVAGRANVVRPFVPPPTPYTAGHRGVDLSVPPRAAVFAAADGRVVFAGRVAGRGLVVLEHADGLRTEYEPMTVAVIAGANVRAGITLGRVSGTHGSCPPQRCLHWSARRRGTYLDPMTLLVRLGPVRLMPWREGVTPAGVPG